VVMLIAMVLIVMYPGIASYLPNVLFPS